MSRSQWKGPFMDKCLFKKEFSAKKKLFSRRSQIPSFLVGETILVHTGRSFKRLYITREKVGYKFGDFCFTRQYNSLKLKNKLKLKK